jgi:hypothetical protein
MIVNIERWMENVQRQGEDAAERERLGKIKDRAEGEGGAEEGDRGGNELATRVSSLSPSPRSCTRKKREEMM